MTEEGSNLTDKKVLKTDPKILERNRANYHKHRDKRVAYARKYRIEKRGDICKRRRIQYYTNHIENIERARLYRQENKQEISERRKKDYTQNKQKVLEYNKIARQKRQDRFLSEYWDCECLAGFFSNLSKGLKKVEKDEQRYYITLRQNNPIRVCYACGKDKSTLDLRDNSERWYINPVQNDVLWWCYNCYQAITLSKYTVFGVINEYKCRRCGEADLVVLQLDHVNGGGRYEIEVKFKGLKNMYRFYIKNPEIAKKRLQVLCANCNLRKRVEKGEGNTKYIPLE